jgi:hypothetical protein
MNGYRSSKRGKRVIAAKTRQPPSWSYIVVGRAEGEFDVGEEVVSVLDA